MRILLTGATGFLGSALARHWAAAGHELVLLGRPASDTARIAAILPRVRFERVAGTADVAAVVAASAPDVVVHTACAYGRHGETALEMLDANVGYGLALLQGVLDGAPTRATVVNTATVLAPDVSAYALAKHQFSQWGATLARQHAGRLRFVDVRLQQMYGPGDDDSKFTTHVLRACRDNAARLALTPGEQRRDFIHVDDVVHAYDRIVQRRDDFAAADAIDVGSGDAVRMRDFVELVHRLAGAATALDFGAVPYRENEAMLCLADTRRLSSLGWTPRFDLESGLRQTLQQASEQ
jgi:nucleoside-diphosphate-sugar epimerase